MDIINIEDSSSDDDSIQGGGGKLSVFNKKGYTAPPDSSSDEEEDKMDIDEYLEGAAKRRAAAMAAADDGNGSDKNNKKKKKAAYYDDDDSSLESILDGNKKMPAKKSTKKRSLSNNVSMTLDSSDDEEMGVDNLKAGNKNKKKGSGGNNKSNGKKKSGSDNKSDGGTKKRKKKDPNAPKNPRTAYTFFTMAVRKDTKEENPDATFGEIAKLMSEKWKALEDKDHYEQQAKDDKKRYQNEMKNYTPPDDDDGDDDNDSGETGKKKPKAKRTKKSDEPLPITNRLAGPLDFGTDSTEYEENWNIIMLMDVREFGQHKSSTDILGQVESLINQHFNGVHCEQRSLPVADYMFVARKYNGKGEVVDERILPILIERKNVNDLQCCLIADSKTFAPLGFFEAQMYKLQMCGLKHKIFLIEGDEDNPLEFSNKNTSSTGIAPPEEQMKRLKRVKTTRMQLERGEYKDVKCINTKSKEDTISFLIQQLANLKQSSYNDPAKLSDLMTMTELKEHIKEQMNGGTFQEFLRLMKQPGIGPAKAMKTILDPDLDWDKNFINPSTKSKKTKSTLQDRAVFWNESSTEAVKRQQSNAARANIPYVPSNQGDNTGSAYAIPFEESIGNNPHIMETSQSNAANNWQGQSAGIRLGGKKPSSANAKRESALAAAERRRLQSQNMPQAGAKKKTDCIVLDSDGGGESDDDDVIVID